MKAMIDLILCWMIIGCLVSAIGFSVVNTRVNGVGVTTGWQRASWAYSVYIYLLFSIIFPYLAYRVWIITDGK